MDKNSVSVIQGASVSLLYGLTPPIDMSSGWVCTVEVIPEALGKSGTPSITKTITDLSANNKYFVGKLTPAETAGLAIGKYWVIADMNNVALGLNGENQQLMEITEQGII